MIRQTVVEIGADRESLSPSYTTAWDDLLRV